jgi:hypothetical protein
MQRYFFNLANEVYPVDLQGIEFPSLAEATAEAVRFTGEVFCDRPELVSSNGELRVEVTDPNRAVLFTLVTSAIQAATLPSVRASIAKFTGGKSHLGIPSPLQLY